MQSIDKDSIVIPAGESDNEDYVRGYTEGYMKGFKEGLVEGTELITEFGGIQYVHTKGKAFDQEYLGT